MIQRTFLFFKKNGPKSSQCEEKKSQVRTPYAPTTDNEHFCAKYIFILENEVCNFNLNMCLCNSNPIDTDFQQFRQISIFKRLF